MQNHTSNDKKISPKAFSLLELSIVILIASILITGALTFSSSNTDQAKIESTRQKMDIIYKAIGNFVAANGRLPCPADITQIKSSSATYGAEIGAPASQGGAPNCSGTGLYSSTTTTSLIYGMIPTKTLGLSNDFAEDGFGTKIVYVIDKNLTSEGRTSATVITGSYFGAQTPTNQITVNSITNSGSSSTLTTNAAFILISYGKNKFYGFNNNSSSKNSDSTDTTDEGSNSIGTISGSGSTGTGTFDSTFVLSSDRSDVFDDFLFFKSRNQIVSDFNLLDKVYCAPTTSQPLNISPFINATNFSWSGARYGEISTSTTACPISGCPSAPCFNKGPAYPTRRCEAYGNWGPTINNCLN